MTWTDHGYMPRNGGGVDLADMNKYEKDEGGEAGQN